MKAGNDITFLDLIMRCCIHFFGSEKGAKVYDYYLENSEFIVSTIIHNKILEDEYFLHVKFMFQWIETELFQSNFLIYYTDFPYDSSISRPVSYKIFLINAYDFYAATGEHKIDGSTRTRLSIERKILDFFITKNAKESIYNNENFSNQYRQEQEQLYSEIKGHEPEIKSKYEKEHRDLTQSELIEFVEKDLKKNIPDYKIKQLWNSIKRDT